MFKRWKNPHLDSRTVLGIDIGPNAVRVLELYFDVGVLNIAACAETKTLTEMEPVLRSGLFRTREVVAAVPDTAVITKTLLLNAALTDAEVEAHIQLEAEHYFGYPSTDIAFDFVIENRKKEKTQMQVLVVAAKRQEMEQRLSALKALGFKVIAMDVESHAIARAVQLQQYSYSCLVASRENTLQLIGEKNQQIFLQQEQLSEEKSVARKVAQMLQVINTDDKIKRLLVLRDQTELEELISKEIDIPIKVIHPWQEILISSRCDAVRKKFSDWLVSYGLALWQTYE